MIKITSLTMRNFMSVGAVTLALNLDKHGFTLILGENVDVGGKNGVGKSTIIHAISFALYGKPLSQIRIPNLINNINGRQMMVTIDFEKDGTKYRIERGRKPDILKFFINKQQMKEDEGSEQGENRHTQTEIDRAIGMSHNMFKNIVALNTMTEPFLRSAIAAQRTLIEELLGIDQISNRAETLKLLISSTKENMRDEQAKIKAIIEANTHIENAIANSQKLSLSWNNQHEKDIAQFSQDISDMQSIDYDAEIIKFDDLDAWNSKQRDIRYGLDNSNREVDILERELGALETELARFQKEANPDISGQIKRLETEKSRKERDRENVCAGIIAKRAELDKLESDIKLSGKLECFGCGQPLEGTDHLEVVLAKMRKNVSKLSTAIAADEKTVTDLAGEIAHLDDEINHVTTAAETKRIEAVEKIADREQQIDEKRFSIIEHTKHLTASKQQLAALGDRPETLFTSRDEVYKTKQTYDALVRELELEQSKTNPHEHQIETLQTTLQVVNYDNLNEFDNLYKHQDFLLRLLTNKDSFIRKKIIESNLHFLNTRMNYYLDKLGLPHEVKFMNDLSVEIILLGKFWTLTFEPRRR